MAQKQEHSIIKQSVQLCLFQRNRFSVQEKGIMIGDGDLIVDKNNKPVNDQIWSYTTLPHEGLIWFELT